LCREGMAHSAHSLRRVYDNSQKQVVDAAGREELCLTSLLGGLALANAKLGAVHGFAGPLGGIAHAAHGAICACLLPHTLEINVRALRQRDPNSTALDRFTEISRILTGSSTACIDDGIAWIKDLTGALHIPSLSALGVKKSDFPLLIEKAAASSSMKGNPVQLMPAEMAEILEKSW
jgi:alcohol dehydrogenase class IV